MVFNFDFTSSNWRQWALMFGGNVVIAIAYAMLSPIMAIIAMALLCFAPQMRNIVDAIREHGFEPLRMQMGMTPTAFYGMVVKNNLIGFIYWVILMFWSMVQVHCGWQAIQAAHMILHCSAAASFVA